jgi:2-oxoisovalerate dehydrogenase E2 component (dihydrolipoyl transacylase)
MMRTVNRYASTLAAVTPRFAPSPVLRVWSSRPSAAGQRPVRLLHQVGDIHRGSQHAATSERISSSLLRCNPALWKRHASSSSTTIATTTTLTPFLLADIGEGIAEVEILEWYVKPGDVIAQFDLICQVQSDKATVDITSRYDGMVDSLHANGAVGSLLRVGQPLLHLKSSSAETVQPVETTATPNVTNAADCSVPSPLPHSVDADSDSDSDDEDENAMDSTATAAAPTMPSLSHNIQASPAVRKLCREHAIDLATVSPGSGPGGRILKADILAHVEALGRASKIITEPVVVTTDSVAASGPPPINNDQIIPLRGYRRQMFKSMTAALQTPHMCLSDELVMNELLQARQVLNASLASTNAKVSVLALLCKAISCTLLDFPILNAHVTTIPSSDGSNDAEVAILQRAHHNLGIAMDTSKGLVVPVLRHCQQKSVVEIARELDRLKAIASSSTAVFRPEDLTDVTLTISNIGSMGAGLSVHPVLAPPTLAMIALGRIQTVPRFSSNVTATTAASSPPPSVYAASVMTVTYAADHRYIEGATLARFHVRLAEYVQQPLLLLSKLA